MPSSSDQSTDAGDAGKAADPTDSHRENEEGVRRPGRLLDHRLREGEILRLDAERAWMIISAPAPGIVRLRYGVGEPGDPPRNGPAIDPAFEARPAEMRLSETASGLVVRLPELRMEVAEDDLGVRLTDADGRTVSVNEFGEGTHSESPSDRTQLVLDRRLRPDERLYGLGGAGRTRTGTDPAPARGKRPPAAEGELKVPVVIGRHGDGELNHGLLVERPIPVHWKLDSEGNHLRLEAPGRELNFFLLSGPTPEETYERLALLTGHHPMPPHWALGLRRSAVGADSEDLERRTYRASRHAAFPLDAIHRSSPLPAPLEPPSDGSAAFDEALGASRIHLTVPLSGRGGDRPDEPPDPDAGRDEQTAALDEHRSPSLEQENPLDRLVRTQIEHGADGFHLTGAFTSARRARAVFHGCRRAESRRPVLTTSGMGAGGHRYAGTWLGRPLDSGPDLIDRIRRCLSISASGQVMVGFNPHPEDGAPEDLLLAGIRSALAMPLLWVEPPAASDELLGLDRFDESVVRAYRRALHLRYKMLPYLYGLFDRHRRTGAPIVRPPGLAPGDLGNAPWASTASAEQAGAFLLGPNLLVLPSPTLGEHGPIEPADLRGEWYELQGTRPLGADPTVSEVPIYVRAGTVLPLRPLSRHSRPRPGSPIVLRYYPGSDRRSELYLDDGISYAYRTGRYRRLQIETVDREDLRIAVDHRGRFPIERPAIEWQIPRRNWRTVFVDGTPIDTTKNPELFVRDTDRAYRGRTYLRIRTQPEVRSLRLVRSEA